MVQLSILLMLVFSADSWLDVPSGRSLDAGPTVHFTVVFNVFVFMQVCGVTAMAVSRCDVCA